METFAIKFTSASIDEGYAVVVAPSEMVAKDILMGELKKRGLISINKKKNLVVSKVPKSQGVLILFGG